MPSAALHVRTQHRRTVTVTVSASHRTPVSVHVMVSVVSIARVHMARRHPVHHAVAHRVRRGHSLLLLSSIAEPHAHHLLLQLQRVGQRRYLLRRGLWLFVEVLLERPLHRHLDAGPLFPLPTLRRDLVDAGRRTRRRVGLLQPLLQQRLQLAHVLETELQRLEPADCRLTEHIPVQRA